MRGGRKSNRLGTQDALEESERAEVGLGIVADRMGGMTIKAILRNGLIQPLEPLPATWGEGQELVVEEPEAMGAAVRLEDWAKDLDAAAGKVPASEHERFRQALEEIERESKEAVAREWGMP